MKMQDEAFFKQIESYFAKGEWSTVIAAGKEAIEQERVGEKVYFYVAKAYVRQGQLEEAIATYQKLLNTDFEGAEVHAELGLLYSKKQQFEEAIRHYQQALVFKPDWAQLQFNLAVVFHQLEDWEKAVAAYKNTLELEPNYAAAYFNLGLAYQKQHEFEAAVESYQQAIAIQPNRVGVYSSLGNILTKLNRYADAIDTFRAGLEIDPTQASLHNDLGLTYWHNGHLELALASFEYAVAIEPEMTVAYHNMGKLWRQQGDVVAAIACFRRVIELEPSNVLAYSYCADVLQQVGRIEEAIDCWHQIVSLQPAFINAYVRQGIAIQPQNLSEMARFSCARFLAVLEQKSNYSEIYHYLWQAYCCLGEIWFERGESERAEIYYRQALEIKTDEPEIYLRLGSCLAKQERLDAAIAIYRMGLIIEGDSRELKIQLSKVIRSKSSLELFPVNKSSSWLPQKLYHRTQDWARDCQLDNFSYTTISWEDHDRPQITGKRQPELISSDIELEPQFDGISYSTPRQLGQNAYQCCFDRSLPTKSVAPFVVTIPQGRTWIAPQQSSWQICNALAFITPDGYLLKDLSPYYSWFLSTPDGKNSSRHPLFRLNEVPPAAKIEGKAVVLSGIAGHLYERWMFDVLPRIELIRRSNIDLNSIDWFVVNNIDRSFQQETLASLEIPPNKVLSSDRYSHITATQLIVPSSVGDLDWVSSETIEFLRQTFLAENSSFKTPYGTKIYLSRSQATDRQIINEAEVVELLDKYGFQTVCLAEMPIKEQAVLFANVRSIVAPHCSGLANLAFCQPNTKVIEIFSPNYVRTEYWAISRQLQLQHYYLLGDRFDCEHLRHLMYQTPAAEEILVNLNSLELILKTAKVQSV